MHGTVIASRAKVFNRHDGSGLVVKVTHELFLDDGIGKIEEWVNPAEDTRVKLDGMEVAEWPKLNKFAHVDYLVQRMKLDSDGRSCIATAGRVLRCVMDARYANVASGEIPANDASRQSANGR